MKSIKNKIIVFALLSTLVPSMVLGLLSFHQNEKLIKENVKRELRILASHASHEIDAWVNQNIHEANSLTSAKILIDALSNAATPNNEQVKNTSEILTHYLRSVHTKLETILELTVIDPQKNVIASSSDQQIPKKPLQEKWLGNKISQYPVVSPPLLHEQFDTVITRIALPIISYDNYILGRLVLTYDLLDIKPALKNSPKSPRGEILLLDSDGGVLLASHIEIR